MLTVLPLAVVAVGGSLALATGLAFKRGAFPVAWIAAALAALAGLWAWLVDAGDLVVPWASEWGSDLSFGTDGLGTLFVLLSSGIGAAIFIYSGSYLEGSLHHRLRALGWMLLFLISMIALALARDLLVMFVAFDMTTLCSYQLIGHERDDAGARKAAFTAVVVTGVTSAFFLLASVLLAAEGGGFGLQESVLTALASDRTAAATWLIVFAAVAKSAQVPFHFWLLRAMAAPTPVSAYLHSAAMVAAGTFVLARLHPLIELVPASQEALLGLGIASIFVGGVSALFADEMKKILAYSTVAQYGFMVVLLSQSTHIAHFAFAFYLVAHGIAKSALFLTAGAVTKATDEEDLSALGGLAKDMPLLAVSSGVAAAALAGLPLTMGFFKDEVLFGASLEGSGWLPPIFVAGAAVTFAYTGRLWSGIFLGPRRGSRSISPGLIIPIVLLAGVLILGGFYLTPFEAISESAAEAIGRGRVSENLTYHFDARAENLMALSAYAGGLILFLLQRRLAARERELPGLRIGSLFDRGMAAADVLSNAAHRFEVRDLRERAAAVLVPAAVIVVIGVAATAGTQRYEVGPLQVHDVRSHLLLAALVVGTVTAAVALDHLSMIVRLAVAGYITAVFFAVSGAPEVALVATLVGTVLTIVWIAILPRIPDHPPAGEERQRAHRLRLLVGTVVAVSSFLVVWGTLSERSEHPVSEKQMAAVEETDKKNVVTAILTDIRGFDTLGEATVVAAVILGIMTLRREDPA